MTIKIINKIILIFFLITSSAHTESITQIRYLDFSIFMNKSLAGKSISSQLNIINKNVSKKFIDEGNKLKDEEKNILSQKNVLSEKDFKNKINKLRSEINDYKVKRQKSINDFKKKKIKAEKQLLVQLSEVMTKYLKDNNISFVLQKKNILIAKSELDITKDIIKIFDKKVKKIDIK
jgi:Skp family chaperone for outer membrane proteins|tara:strand:+ start:2164 stop:2694 length:531 start_codon:yes stop_codon:yes gene_type:complete